MINIALKKQVNTKNSTSEREFPTLISNLRTRISKTDKFLRISTNIIITKSSERVSN